MRERLDMLDKFIYYVVGTILVMAIASIPICLIGIIWVEDTIFWWKVIGTDLVIILFIGMVIGESP